jgi:twitching motility protein PilT
VGEIRNAESAAQVLRAATSGHLVITTLHAGSIEEALSNLVQISEQILGDRAAEQCADALTAVIHQRLGAFGPSMKVVVTEKGNAGDPVRKWICKQSGSCTNYKASPPKAHHNNYNAIPPPSRLACRV